MPILRVAAHRTDGVLQGSSRDNKLERTASVEHIGPNTIEVALYLIEERSERVVDTLIVAELDDIAVGIAKHAHVTDRLGKVDRFPFKTTSRGRLGGGRINIGTLGHLHTEVRERKELWLLIPVMFIEVHQYQYERMLRRCRVSEPCRLTCIIGSTLNQP
jgi:hypothetical protein